MTKLEAHHTKTDRPAFSSTVTGVILSTTTSTLTLNGSHHGLNSSMLHNATRTLTSICNNTTTTLVEIVTTESDA
jgi:hypothetical protein